MNYIDVLEPVSKIFEKDEWVSQIKPEKLSAVSKGLSIKAFINKWTDFTLKRDGGLDEMDVELIQDCLKKYNLNIDDDPKTIDKYQAKVRNLFGTTLSKEEKVLIKNIKKNKVMETKAKVGKKKICVPLTKSVVTKTPNDVVVNDEKFFRFMMMYKSETGCSVKESCEAIDEFFEFRNKNNKTVNVVKVDDVKVDDVKIKVSDVDWEQMDNITIREKILFAINKVPLFFTILDIENIICEKYGDFNKNNRFYNTAKEVFNEYCSTVQADFYPVLPAKLTYRPYNVYVLKKNVSCLLKYEQYYEWLLDKNNTIRTVFELKRDFTRMEFLKEYREAVGYKDSKATVFYNLLKNGKIKQISDDKYRMGPMLSGPIVFKS